MILPAHAKDLGDGFFVNRALPQIEKRSVGPFLFLDHMGPAMLPPGKGLNVRPHPHINLATVTYLFEGSFRHRDSLGSDQIIEPGAINWMTAGKGIVHSERMPEHLVDKGGPMHGIQLWIGLPTEHEECEPSFSHHPKSGFQEFQVEDAKLKLLLGKKFGKISPVPVLSDIFYLEGKLKKDGILSMPTEGQEAGVYLVSGKLEVDDQAVSPKEMFVSESDNTVVIKASVDSHFMLLGGKSLGPRYLLWNFVSSSKDRLEEVKLAWAQGPKADNERFHPIPGDDIEFIPFI
jgi:redox-sensitive bicupin YhaK (pirin superfamily)